ncbi:hypothetical protein ILUMI_23955 [Ignelater luminosus]|uniref:Uncharacterized protein n=1 Tax=Ignelater luminosus TaxID=2038154 RepID=A0A8K0CCW9_IGNLU|nr:hypothetical protein ILUMI_23955 [Ignelater luminosus]
MLVVGVIKFSEWGFPMTRSDIKFQRTPENVSNLKNNIKLGFRGCEIALLCPDAVLKKIPDVAKLRRLNRKSKSLDQNEVVYNSKSLDKRRKKLQVSPDRGIKRKDLDDQASSSKEIKDETNNLESSSDEEQETEQELKKNDL